MALAGRIMGRRRHGEIMFLDIKDQSGLIQIALTKNSPLILLDGKGGSKTSIQVNETPLDIFDLVDGYFDI